MAYPVTNDTFQSPVAGTTLTNAAGADHAAEHNLLGSAVGTIERVVGTTAGTNVLKNFAAGDFPSRLNASNVLQQPISGTLTATLGTLNNVVIGTPAITGGTVTAPVISNPTIRAYQGWIDANESWSFSSADGQTGVITVPSDATLKYQVGMRIFLTQSATVKYAVITAVTTTTLTALFNSDAALANAAITVPFYSSARAPFGFNCDPSKYDVITHDTSSRQQLSPTQNTWYNLGGINIIIPIGLWRVWYNAEATSDEGVNSFSFEVALSTANNSNSDADFHMRFSGSVFANTSTATVGPITRQKQLSLASKTTYFLNMLAGNASNVVIRFRGDESPTIIKAEFLLL